MRRNLFSSFKKTNLKKCKIYTGYCEPERVKNENPTIHPVRETHRNFSLS